MADAKEKALADKKAAKKAALENRIKELEAKKVLVDKKLESIKAELAKLD
jgi:uncharacterized coiled-coil protein SlyX